MTSFRFMKDIFGEEVAPYVCPTDENQKDVVLQYFGVLQNFGVFLLPIKTCDETDDRWAASESRVHSFRFRVNLKNW